MRFQKNRRAIGKALQELFPGHRVSMLEVDGDAFVRIVGEDGAVKHRIQMSREFVSNQPSDEALALCARWHLIEALKAAGTVKLFITSQGITWAGQTWNGNADNLPASALKEGLPPSRLK
jgi:hypothetical protein